MRIPSLVTNPNVALCNCACFSTDNHNQQPSGCLLHKSHLLIFVIDSVTVVYNVQSEEEATSWIDTNRYS